MKSSNEKGPLHTHIQNPSTAGPYNMSIYIKGNIVLTMIWRGNPVTMKITTKNSSSSNSSDDHTDDTHKLSKCDQDCHHESFIRLLTTLVPINESKAKKIVTIQIIFLIFDRHETLHFERVGYAANDMDLYLDLID